MPLPYENATAGQNALTEIERILQGFGCSKFGVMRDYDAGELLLQFEWRSRQISLRVSFEGYAAAWLREHLYSCRMKRTQDHHKERALKQSEIAAPSILRDWVKAQVTTIEVGLIPFDHVFMPYMLAHDGRPLVEHAVKLLPPPEREEDELAR